MKSARMKMFSYLALLGVVVIWGSSFLVTKNLYSEVDPITLILYRFGIATFFVLMLFRFKHLDLVRESHRKVNHFPLAVLCGLLLFAFFVLHNLGIKYTSAGNSGLIIGMTVVFVPIWSWVLLKERFNRIYTFSILASAIGFLLVSSSYTSLNQGDLLCLAAAVVYSLYLVLVSIISHRGNPFVSTLIQFLIVTGLSLATVGFFGLPISSVSPSSLLGIVYLGIGASFLGFLMINVIEKYLPPFHVAVFINLKIVIATGLAWFVGGEAIYPNNLAGSILIILSIFVVILLKHRRRHVHQNG